MKLNAAMAVRAKIAQTVSPPQWVWDDDEKVWLVEIPKISKSINRTHGSHWSIARRERDEWARWVAVSLDKPPKAESKRSLVIERLACSNGLDRDNLYGSYKQLIDAIRDAGIIVDDSDKWLDLKIINQRAATRAENRTVIVVGVL